VGSESHGQGGKGASPDHNQKGPAAQERHQRPVGLAQEDVLAAACREHGSQLRKGEGAREREQAREQPHADNACGRAHISSHEAGGEENTGADHHPDHERSCVKKPEPACKSGGRHGGQV